jgi:PPOX class probable F420-dependent enzyme
MAPPPSEQRPRHGGSRTIGVMIDTIASSATRPIDGRVRSFLEAPNYASIATLDPDGAPRQAVVWYLFDGRDLIVNSLVGRRWPANLQRDPRIAVSVIDQADGLRWVGITGTTEPIVDQAQAQADIAAMARRYGTADPEDAERLIRDRFSPQERISFRVRIESLHDHLG